MTRLPPSATAKPHATLLRELVADATTAFDDTGWDPGAVLPGDLGLALLDGVAVGVHLLSVYQEAWGREGFLGTASREDSVHALLADLGYRPAPSVAAVGLQQLRCREGATATVPAGFAIQAPALGELPEALFETLRPITIHPAFNRIRARGPELAPPPTIPTTGTSGTSGGALPAGLSAAGALGQLLAAQNSAYRDAAADGRARKRIAELHRAKDLLDELGALDEDLADLLCEAADAEPPPQNLAPVPPSQMQRLMADRVAALPAEAQADLAAAVAPCEGEGEAERNARLGALAGFLDALGESLLQGARDATVLTEGAAALKRMDTLFATPPGAGILPAGTELLTLVFASTHPPLRAGDWLVLAEEVDRRDSGGNLVLVPVARQGVRIVAVEGDRVRIDPPLAAPIRAERLVILGNVVAISAGSTAVQPLVYDGAPIVLEQGPLTWLRDALAPNGRRPALSVTVQGVRWPVVDRLLELGPDAPGCVIDPLPAQKSRIRFAGTVPVGAEVVVTYRVGAGTVGNRPAGAVDTIVGSEPAVESTTNPLPTWGGADGEPVDEARLRAPAAVRAMDRAVSFDDLAAVARRFVGVAHARVFRPRGSRGRVVVVAAGPGAEPLPGPTASELLLFLRARVPPGVSLEVAGPRRVPVRVAALIRGRPGADPITVLRGAREALGLEPDVEGLLSPSRLALDDDLDLSEVYAALRTVPGVRGVLVTALHRTDDRAGLSMRVSAGPDEVLAWDPGGVTLHYEEDTDR